MTDEAKVKSDKRYRKMMKRNNEKRRKIKKPLEPKGPNDPCFPTESTAMQVPVAQTVHSQRCLRKDGGKNVKATGDHTRKSNPQLPSVKVHKTVTNVPKHILLESKAIVGMDHVLDTDGDYLLDPDGYPMYEPRHGFVIKSLHSNKTSVKIDRVGGGRPMSEDRATKGYTKKERKSHASAYEPSAKIIRRWTAKAARIVKAIPVSKPRLNQEERITSRIAVEMGRKGRLLGQEDKTFDRKERQSKNRILTESQRAAKQARLDVIEANKVAMKPVNRIIVKANTITGEAERRAHMLHMRDLAKVKRAAKIAAYKKSQKES